MGFFKSLTNLFSKTPAPIEPVEAIIVPTPVIVPKVKEVPVQRITEPTEGAPRAQVKTIPNHSHFNEFYSNHRQHQKEACVSLDTETIGQVIIPTGTGKTRIQVSTHINDMISSPSGVYLIGAHRLMLCHQLLDDLLSEAHQCGLSFDLLFVGSNRMDANKIYSKYQGLNKSNCQVKHTLSEKIVTKCAHSAKQNNRHLIIVCTYHSFRKLFNIPVIEICTYDEAHTLTAPTFKANVSLIKPNIKKNFFFTATPKNRGEDGGMKDFNFFGKPIYEMAPRTAIDAGEIVAPKLHIIKSVDGETYTNQSMHIRVVQAGFDKHREMVDERIGAKILISTTGNKEMFEIIHDEEFQTWCKDKVRVIAFSSSQEANQGYYVDFKSVSRQDAFDALKSLKDEEDALLFHIEILTEGIDLPSITGVMPFRSLESGKLFQTLGRASRLIKSDRTALYAGEMLPTETEKFIKPNSWLILPKDFKHLVNYAEMKKIMVDILNEYEIPIDQLVIDNQYLADKSALLPRIPLSDSAKSRDKVCDITHIFEDIIVDTVSNMTKDDLHNELLNLG